MDAVLPPSQMVFLAFVLFFIKVVCINCVSPVYWFRNDMVCYCKVVCQHCAWNYVNFNLKMVGCGVYFGWVGRGVTVGGHECSEKVFHLILSFFLLQGRPPCLRGQ